MAGMVSFEGLRGKVWDLYTPSMRTFGLRFVLAGALGVAMNLQAGNAQTGVLDDPRLQKVSALGAHLRR